MTRYISQKGEDGFGHQLLGMMSIISLCSTDMIYVPYLHDGKFEHVSGEEKLLLKTYMIKFYQMLGFEIPCDFSQFPPKRVVSRNRNNFNYDVTDDLDWPNHTHVFDNAWSVPGIGKKVFGYEFYKSLTNEHLLKSDFNSDYTNIVIHLRGGDGDTRHFGTRQNMSILNKIIRKLKENYVKCKFNFHTNNETINDSLLVDIPIDRYQIFGKNTPVLFSFSHMINADVLIVGDSSLSIAASYVNKGVVLVPDKLTCAEGKDIDIHPLNGIENAISFKNYLSS
jgi:hypothetical protein